MTTSSVKDRPGHYVLWSLGVFLAALPFLILFFRPDLRAPWFHEPGQFADNLVLTGKHLILGATLGGWLWFLLNRVNPIHAARGWWKTPSLLNWPWFVLTLAIYATHNVLVLTTLPMSGIEFASVALGRTLTAFIVLTVIWFGVHIASLAAPTRLRFLPWAIPAIIPGFLGADALAIIFWKNSLRYTLNKLDEDGPIDIAKQLAAAGFHSPPTLLIGQILILFGVLCFLCYFASRASGRLRPLISLRPASFIVIAAISWGGIASEKATGFVWKSRKALRMEHNSYDIHLTPIKPKTGLVSYQATWKPLERPLIQQQDLKNPDLFLIVVESVRLDAIEKNHTPFLSYFQKYEAQQLGHTWATSNATHLSWYSLFNGQIPPHWGDAMDLVRDGQELPPSPLIELLQKSSYRLHARTVCDLSYLGMSATNFGSPHQLDFLKDYPADHESDLVSLPQRELLNRRDAQDSLLVSPSSGNFHFLAFDSPHFDYVWHQEFEPPYTDFEPAGGFHAFPKPEDIERVRRRYLNSVAWTDNQIEKFIDHLKIQNRYDDAIIIITSDHGEEFQEHGSWFHCSSLEPEQTAVPFLIKWPEGTETPAHQSASHLDLLPSLMDYFGHQEETYRHLPGRSLLKTSPQESTQIVMTSYGGIMGVAMAWHRDGYTATFRWKDSWSTQLPDQIELDDIVGPQGSLLLETEDQWDQELQKRFPDASDRLFEQLLREPT